MPACTEVYLSMLANAFPTPSMRTRTTIFQLYLKFSSSILDQEIIYCSFPPNHIHTNSKDKRFYQMYAKRKPERPNEQINSDRNRLQARLGRMPTPHPPKHLFHTNTYTHHISIRFSSFQSYLSIPNTISIHTAYRTR